MSLPRRFRRLAGRPVVVSATFGAAWLLGVLAFPLAAQTTPPATPELQEATRISARVVQFYQAGRYQEALPLAQQALALREKELGAEHPLVGEAAHNLASVYMRLNDFAQAEKLAQRASDIAEKSKPPQESNQAAALYLLGSINYTRFDYDTAAQFYQRSLTLREKILGPEHLQTLDTVLALANTYHSNGAYDSAEFLYRIYVDVQNKRGGNQTDVGYALERLSCVLWKKGDTDKAEETESRADKLLGYSSPVTNINDKDLRAHVIFQPSLDFRLDKKYLEDMLAPRRGAVAVRVLADEKGEVLRACAMFGPSPLLSFYENVAHRIRFTPFTNEGQPVKATGLLKYIYSVEPVRRR